MPFEPSTQKPVAEICQLECRRVANGHEYGCATCTFWSCNLQDIQQGECHYDPPRVFVGASQGGQTQLISVWPTTKRAQWCGRHLFENADKENRAFARSQN